MRRFFVDQKSISDNHAFLSANESHHITSVLRLQTGELVELFDGRGTLYTGTLKIESSQSVTVHIVAQQQLPEQQTPHLYLYQSLLKGKKMDFLVQKCTELGVHSLHPLLTRFSKNRGNHKRQGSRWQRIMLESCKQCKRSRPMKINPSSPLIETDFSYFSAKLLLWEGENSRALHQHHFSGAGTVCLLLGPEGGFHQDEIVWARAQGFQTVSLGPRILRAETASLSAITIVQFLCGMLAPVN